MRKFRLDEINKAFIASGKVNLVTGVYGILPAANGGLGAGTNNAVLYYNGSGTLSADSAFTYGGTNLLVKGLQVGTAQQFIIDTSGLCAMYNNIATTGKGIPAIYGVFDQNSNTAAIAATTLFTPSTLGLYRVSWVASIQTAATTSSVLGGTNGFQLKYTDGNDSVVKTTVAANSVTSTANTTGTSISGVESAYCKASTALQFTMDYTSVGVTQMNYNLHIRVDAL